MSFFLICLFKDILTELMEMKAAKDLKGPPLTQKELGMKYEIMQ